VVAGNRIGTNLAGNAAILSGTGIHIDDDAASTRIGTNSDGIGDVEERNIISGNSIGVSISGSDSNDTIVAGNYIGTDLTGAFALGNGSVGVLISGDNQVTIGGTAAGAGNVISGNTGNGISISGNGGANVQGNIVGLNAAGNADLGNGQFGIFISSPNNTIGGTAVGARNIISGNNASGVHIQQSRASGNVIAGNFIGTDITGTIDLGNTSHGIELTAESTGNTIGGSAAGAGNLIHLPLTRRRTTALARRPMGARYCLIPVMRSISTPPTRR
jgi:hypothetical protein